MTIKCNTRKSKYGKDCEKFKKRGILILSIFFRKKKIIVVIIIIIKAKRSGEGGDFNKYIQTDKLLSKAAVRSSTNQNKIP